MPASTEYERVNGKPTLYINWKCGLGDVILHVSLYYWYAKHINKKICVYGNTKLIDRKMRQFIVVSEKDQPDITEWIEQISVEKIRKSDSDIEDFSDWIPIPSDNCIEESLSQYDYGSFITAMTTVMKFNLYIENKKDCDFYHDYLLYKSIKKRKNVIFHLIGTSSGSYENNYHTSKANIKLLVSKAMDDGYDIKFTYPHDDWMKKSFPHAEFLEEADNMTELFDLISSAIAVVSVDSGIAHVARCCLTNLFLFKTKRTNGLGFTSEDGTFIEENSIIEFDKEYNRYSPYPIRKKGSIT